MNSSNVETQFPCLYDIPGYSTYAITVKGDVFNKKRGEFLTGSRNPDGYVNIRLTDDEGVTLTWGRHRLLGYVFKHPGPNVGKMVVNHLNAIKGDDRLDNLEWTTYQGNAHHAGSLGLTTKCMPISVRDVNTGIVVKYPSIVECAREFGVSKDFINWRVKAGEYKVFPEGKQYRPSHSDEPWCSVEKVKIRSLQGGKAKSVLARNVLTNEILEFKTMGQLADHLQVSASTVTGWLQKTDQAVLPGFVQLKWTDDPAEWRMVVDPYLELQKHTGERSVNVTNSQTGEVRVFKSANECAKALGISPTALNYRLKSNDRTTFSDGHRYSYYSS